MTDAVLSLNAGSSSIKFALFGMGGGADFTKRLHGQMDGLDKAPHLKAQDMAGKTLTDQHWEDGATKTHEARVQALVGWLESHLGGEKLVAVGHRVVHGGRDFTGPVLIDDAVLAKLEALTPLAPLHQPGSLAPIKALMATRPGLPQIACFDTAYHHTMPVVATRFALPLAFEEDGVRRYGFHGLSYEYIASQLRKDVPQLAHGRVIVAHLGNGASLCAMLDGRSVDTTMGFTALDGLVMGTRCGAVDPGVLLYLLQQKGMAPGDLEHLLYDQSGLLGVSGVSSDIRELTASQDLHARDAIDLFVFSCCPGNGGARGEPGWAGWLRLHRRHWRARDRDPGRGVREAAMDGSDTRSAGRLRHMHQRRGQQGASACDPDR